VIAFCEYELDAESYKARLLMHLLDVPFTSTNVDVYPGTEHRSPWFLAINPAGTLPVLVDDAATVVGAIPSLLHLASAYDPAGTWSPTEPAAAAEVSRWLAFAAELAASAGAARLHDVIFAQGIDVVAARARAHALLREVDEALWFAEQRGSGWVGGGPHPTIADVACFPDVMLADEGGIPLERYRAVRRWTDRVKSLPRFVPMPGLFAR
jgi:glutathione S-transferase